MIYYLSTREVPPRLARAVPLTNRSRNRMPRGAMQHARLFRKLREEKGLSLDALARLARRHRNTIINLERGRPVKFATIARLMEKLGYPADSPEMASLALLWVESVSGVPLGAPDKLATARQVVGAYEHDARRQVQLLNDSIRRAGLDEREVRLLTFAARHPEVLRILASIHDLVVSGSGSIEALKVAEKGK